ncbi:prephenate dehydratase domain-containing protein [Sphingosinicella sp. CPCC 101087]|uniref:prephenate dehydratase domain-containing protein n=1 Tax=Sphingosinicella sp. CPCC 101087 TaxID=2497754 RepID=UPI00101C86AB|nr:prephenate dehydratase domain-containing protein [Sphingosinicella sp. CPCC 101087]
MSGTVAYQGVRGAFGEEACRLFLPDLKPVPLPTFAAVAEAVARGETGRGMLPRRNSTAGPVPGIDALMEEKGLEVQASHVLPVRLHLLARPGVTLEAVRSVVSHPMALAQCARTLERLGLATEEAANTAMAARAVAESDDSGRAAVASEFAAEAWGLAILMGDVHDRADNATTFCVVTRRNGESR